MQTSRTALAGLIWGAAMIVGAPSASASTPAQLEANKKVVVGFWRAVFDANDATKIVDYLSPDYIQHNPTAPPGRGGLIGALTKRWPHPKAAADIVPTQFTAVVAEDDFVQLVQMRLKPEPGDPSKTYQSFWFDLFRVKDGKIVEHWDSALKPTP